MQYKNAQQCFRQFEEEENPLVLVMLQLFELRAFNIKHKYPKCFLNALMSTS